MREIARHYTKFFNRLKSDVKFMHKLQCVNNLYLKYCIQKSIDYFITTLMWIC